MAKRSSRSNVDLSKLASPENLPHVTPVVFAYDPVPSAPSYLNPPLEWFPNRASRPNRHTWENAIDLYPLDSGLPYRSSLGTVRESRSWRSNLIATVKLLELFAADKSAGDMEVGQGITVAKLSRKELMPGLEHRMVLATPYMYPSASDKRIALIAVLMIVYFVFDDKVEESTDDTIDPFKDDFIRRLQGKNQKNGSTASVLQTYLDNVVTDILEEDAIAGNGGHEMIQALRKAFKCVHPQGDFETLDEYLDFRYHNVGAEFVIAAAKFSIGSSVSSSDPRFERYLRLISYHYGAVNDIHSYDKELRALREGKTKDMINITAVIKRLLSLESEDSAKVATYAYLLQLEAWIMEELHRLEREGNVTDEEWWFLEAVFMTATGNVFFCMVTSRYGGEGARVRRQVPIEISTSRQIEVNSVDHVGVSV